MNQYAVQTVMEKVPIYYLCKGEDHGILNYRNRS
jgi:hypothetical protein